MMEEILQALIKKGESYKKTNNIIKSEKKLRKINNRLNTIRTDYVNKTTTEIMYICDRCRMKLDRDFNLTFYKFSVTAIRWISHL